MAIIKMKNAQGDWVPVHSGGVQPYLTSLTKGSESRASRILGIMSSQQRLLALQLNGLVPFGNN